MPIFFSTCQHLNPKKVTDAHIEASCLTEFYPRDCPFECVFLPKILLAMQMPVPAVPDAPLSPLLDCRCQLFPMLPVNSLPAFSEHRNCLRFASELGSLYPLTISTLKFSAVAIHFDWLRNVCESSIRFPPFLTIQLFLTSFTVGTMSPITF